MTVTTVQCTCSCTSTKGDYCDERPQVVTFSYSRQVPSLAFDLDDWVRWNVTSDLGEW